MSKISKVVDDLFILARDKEKVGKAKVVAALIYKGKVISYGFNQYRTSWVQRRFKKNPESHYLHAEADAVKNAMKVVDNDTISKSTLVVVRAKKNAGKNVFGNAKPCVGCQSCIEWIGINKVYYTTDEGTIEEFK